MIKLTIRFRRKISLEGPLAEGQRSQLLEVADRCPVHRTRTEGASVAAGLVQSDMIDNAAKPAADHMREMQRACVEADLALNPSCATEVLVKQ